MTENANFAPATAADCDALRAQVGPDWMVAYDPEGALEEYGRNDLAMVLDPGETVVFRRQGAAFSAIEDAIAGVLAGAP